MKNETEIIVPVKFEMKQDGGFGIAQNVISFVRETKDARLTSVIIPGHIRDPEEYIRRLEDDLREQDMAAGLIDARALSIPLEQQETNLTPDRIIKPAVVDTVIKSEENVAVGYTNFRLCPNYVERFFDHYGKEAEEKAVFDVSIFFQDMPPKSFKLLVSDVARLTQLVQKKFPYADFDKSNLETAKAIESDFRALTKHLPERKILCDYGWQIVEGRRLYVTDDIPCLPSGFVAQTGVFRGLSEKMQLPQEIICKTLSLSKNWQGLSVLISFSLLGVLYKVFEEAGHSPRFLLFVNGKTGSLKTTLSKILFMQLRHGMGAEEPRRIDADTVTSFERAVVKSGRDTVLLIDDYAPQRTSGKAREMENRIEMLIRMAGDGATKSRSNSKLEDVKGKGVKGVIAVTGEIRAKGLSSNLRCCYCHLKREDVNVETVTWFQENPLAYPQLIAMFTEYVARRWDDVVSYIKEKFPRERQWMETVVDERRLVDSAATLRIACDILGRFLQACLSDVPFDIVHLIEGMKVEIANNAVANQAAVKEGPVSYKVIKTIDELILAKNILMSGYRPTVENIANIDGFEDKDALYFMPEKLYVKLTDYFKRINSPLGYDISDLLETLADEGIIRTRSNGKGARLFGKRIAIGGGKKVQFIEIKKSVYDAVLEGTWDYDSQEGGLL